VTSLAPLIGYSRAAHIAKEAMQSDRTVREVCQEKLRAGELKKKGTSHPITQEELDAALDPRRMTQPEER
jgi:fumarate hydratase class II